MQRGPVDELLGVAVERGRASYSPVHKSRQVATPPPTRSVTRSAYLEVPAGAAEVAAARFSAAPIRAAVVPPPAAASPEIVAAVSAEGPAAEVVVPAAVSRVAVAVLVDEDRR